MALRLIPVARIFLAIGAALLVVGVSLGALQVVQSHQAAVERQDVARYTSGVLPPARLAGQLVAQTIVPMLDAYRHGQVPSTTVAQSAVTWRAFFERTKAAFQKVPHPGKLGPIASTFDRALTEYSKSVAYFELVQGPAAAAALQAGASEAKRADADYATAAGTLGCLRHADGLPAIREFSPFATCPANG